MKVHVRVHKHRQEYKKTRRKSVTYVIVKTELYFRDRLTIRQLWLQYKCLYVCTCICLCQKMHSQTNLKLFQVGISSPI